MFRYKYYCPNVPPTVPWGRYQECSGTNTTELVQILLTVPKKKKKRGKRKRKRKKEKDDIESVCFFFKKKLAPLCLTCNPKL
jgi:hypothetical protein